MRKWIGLCLVLAIATIALLLSKRDFRLPALPAASLPSPRPFSSPLPSPSSTVRDASKPVVEIAPTPERVRSEVERNPHVPSSSLVAFSVELAPRLEAGVKSPAAAETFLSELRECIEGPKLSAMKSLQALCLVNLRRLAEKVPTVRERAQEITERAGPELRRLAE